MPHKVTKRKPEGPELAPGGTERREGGRVPRPRQVAIYPCHPTGLGRPIRASLTDASPTSIGLTCLGNVPVGSHFVLRLVQPSGAPLLQMYHVVRCRAAGAGASIIGAQFDHVFTGKNPVAVGAPATATDGSAVPAAAGAVPAPAAEPTSAPAEPASTPAPQAAVAAA